MKLFLSIILLLLVGISLQSAFAGDSQFVNESKKIELKQSAVSWINGTVTTEVYLDHITELLEDHDLILYTDFDREIPPEGSAENTLIWIKNKTIRWVNDEIDDNSYAGKLIKLIRYKIIDIDNPSKILLSMDKSTYFLNDDIILNIDMSGYFFHEEQINILIETLLEEEKNGHHGYTINEIPTTINLRDNIASHKIGNHTAKVLLHGISSVSFEIIPYYIDIQTDKQSYYLGEEIFVNGTMSNIDWNKDTTIFYEVYNSLGSIKSGSGGILNDDGTFDFTFDFDDTSEMYYTPFFGQNLDITIQNYTVPHHIMYINTPDMENETLHNYTMSNLSKIIELEDAVKLQNFIITQLQTEINNILQILNVTTG